MVRHTLKILQHLLQDLFCLFDESPCSNICKASIGCVNINQNKVNRSTNNVPNYTETSQLIYIAQINWLVSIWWGTLVVNGLIDKTDFSINYDQKQPRFSFYTFLCWIASVSFVKCSKLLRYLIFEWTHIYDGDFNFSAYQDITKCKRLVQHNYLYLFKTLMSIYRGVYSSKHSSKRTILKYIYFFYK